MGFASSSLVLSSAVFLLALRRANLLLHAFVDEFDARVRLARAGGVGMAVACHHHVVLVLLLLDALLARVQLLHLLQLGRRLHVGIVHNRL